MRFTFTSIVVVFAYLLVGLANFKIIDAFHFGFYNNELYISIDNQLSDRGYQTIWGLIQLQLYIKRESKVIPNVLASLDNIDTDQRNGGKLAFWKFHDDRDTVLWPEHDYWGWQSSWQAPYPIYSRALQQGSVPWEHRHHAIFWTGALLNQIRNDYAECAAIHKKVVLQVIDWKYYKGKPVWQYADRQVLKPIQLDSRKRSQYRFNLYLYGLQWSSSLKRIIPSGAALILPSPNPHQSVVSTLLEKHCSDCYLTVSYDSRTAFCENLKHILTNYSIENHHSIRMMTQRLIDFSNTFLSLNATLLYMYDTLMNLSSSQQHDPQYSSEKFQETTKKLHLSKYDCKRLRSEHLSARLRPEDNHTRWQYSLWYDDNCEMLLDSLYLEHTAL